MDKNTFCRIITESNSSYKFLGAPDGFWISGEGVGFLPIDEMSNNYKKNCIEYLKKHRDGIRCGNFLNGIDVEELKLTESDIEDLYKFATEAVDEKIKQLKNI
jgi:hypothetical protein